MRSASHDYESTSETDYDNLYRHTRASIDFHLLENCPVVDKLNIARSAPTIYICKITILDPISK